MFFHVPFNIELISTNVTDITSDKCSFMCKRNLKHINVNCVEYILRKKNRITKHIQIKHNHIWVPGQRYQDSRHLLQNPKVPQNVMSFNNHAQRSTPPYYLDIDNPLHISESNLKF